MRHLLVLAKLDAEKKRTYSAIATATGLDLAVSERVEAALTWLDSHDPRVVAFDTAVVAAEKLCAKVRSRKKLATVPLIAMVSDTSDTFVERLYGLGADDVIEAASGAALIGRLRALPDRDALTPVDRGMAVVADKDHARCDVFGRVLMNAGYDVKFALDDVALRFYTQQAKVRLVVASADLGPPRKFIEEARKVGPAAPWLVTAPRRELMKHAEALAGLERVTIVASTTAPENVLFTSNELLREGGPPARSEDRTLFGTVVGFKAAGAESDDLGFAYNISPNGIYVRTLAAPAEERVWVELRPPRAKRRVRLEGRVAWRRAYDPASAAPAPPGFGVQILDGLGDSFEVWKTHCELYVRTTRTGPAALTSIFAPAADGSTSERPSDAKIAVIQVSAQKPVLRATPPPKPRMFPPAQNRVPEPSRGPPTLESHAGPLKTDEPSESLGAIESEWEVISTLSSLPPEPVPPPPPSRPRQPPPKPPRDPGEPLPIELKRIISSPPAPPSNPGLTAGTVPRAPPLELGVLELAVAQDEPHEPHAPPPPPSRSAPPSRVNVPRQAAPPRFEALGEPAAAPPRSRLGLVLWLLGGAVLGGAAGAAWIASSKGAPNPRPTATPIAATADAGAAIAMDAAADTGLDAGVDAPVDASREVGGLATGDAGNPDAARAAVDAGEAAVALQVPPLDEGDGGDGTELGATLGFLVVRSTATLDVYASGINLGPTNRKNQAPCGLRYVRLGKGNPPSWLTEGRTVDVKCRTVTSINQEPSPPTMRWKSEETEE